LDAEERFNALYRAHYGAVLRYATRRAGQDTARDAVAETFLIAWRRLDDVPSQPGQAEPWLYGVARRVLANAQRSQRRADRLTARLWLETGGSAVPDIATGVSERQRLARALQLLAEPDREALRLIGWEELDLAGAAIAMGCSRSAMAVRLHRARRRLQRALSPSENETAGEQSTGDHERHQAGLKSRQMIRQETP
jgi:RNA polymerase sigma-70 factor, ECF subfamily